MDGYVDDVTGPKGEDELPGHEEGELVAKFDRWDKALDAHWGEWRKESKLLFGFYAGRQFDEDEKTAAKEARRQLVTINRFASIIDAVAGAEITDREKVQYFPREVGDSPVNELLTSGADWIRDRADAEFEESEAYKDALICGVGCTETRMDYEEEPDGQILIDRVDPLEVLADSKSRKPNMADAKYIRRKKTMAREEAEELFGEQAFSGSDDRRSESVKDQARAYTHDTEDAPPTEGEVEISEYQWYEAEEFGRFVDPMNPMAGVQEVSGDQLEPIRDTMPGIVITKRRIYYRAYRSGKTIVGKQEKIAAGQFTYKFITGKRDRNMGTWFGLGRLMKDPQKWANVFFSQILHVINSNAKGGIIADPAGIDDIKKFTEDYAKAEAVTWTSPGALISGQGPGIINKPTPNYPQGLDRLMAMSIDAIQEATGVNKELLGMVGKDQAGVLEHQRKQAAYGILAAFFDGLRRYRKAQGQLLLVLIKFLPDDTLVRIAGKDSGVAQYVPLTKQADTAKFDVIVDEAAAGPNQKERTFQLLIQMMPFLKDHMTPELIGKFLTYSPLPTALTNEVNQEIAAKAQQPDPNQQFEMAAKQADLANSAADTNQKNASAAEKAADAQEAQRRTALMGPPQPIPFLG